MVVDSERELVVVEFYRGHRIRVSFELFVGTPDEAARVDFAVFGS